MKKIKLPTGFRFKGLNWDEREKIISHLSCMGYSRTEMAQLLGTSRQNIYLVEKKINEKNFIQG